MAGFKTWLQPGAFAQITAGIAGILTPLCAALAAQQSGVALTNVAQILSLSPKSTEVAVPVRIRGMVTYHEPGVVLFVQDETGGIFVYHTGTPLGFRAGQYLEVSGFGAPGLYTPIIASPQFQPLEAGPRIVPRTVSMAEIDLGGLDAQWVEFTGVVRGLSALPDRLLLDVAMPPHHLTVRVAECEGYDRLRLVGSNIRVRGVVGTTFINEGRLVAFKVFVSKLSDVTILQEPPANPFSEPLLSIRDLRGQHARGVIPRQVRTRGIVTLCWPGQGLFIHDSDSGLEVQASESVDDLRPGDAIEVAGFPGPVLGPPVLEGALIRKLGTESVPNAVRFTADDLFHGEHNLELVEIEATLLTSNRSASNLWSLVLQGQKYCLDALLPISGLLGETIGIRPGSRVRLTGVCVREDALAETETKVRLLLRSPSDIVALAPPISARRGMTFVSAIAVVATVGLVLALWLIGKQRSRARHMLQLQTSLESEMRQNEQQLRRSMEERERMGRDLHDDIIQSIYAVGLHLEDCRRVLRKSPDQVEARLTSSIETLNNSIRHVRGFLAGLEPKVLNGREFKTALKSLALTSGDDPTPQFQLEVDPSAANRLTPTQATQLLHIAKEAMTNCLRHARASNLLVSLHPASTGLQLEVSDNGEGFGPDTLKATGHGLHNMTTRAREIGADLQIISAVGQGCRILVNLPQRKADEHG